MADPISIYDVVESLVVAEPERAQPGSGFPCCELVALALLGATRRSVAEAKRTPWWGKANIVPPEGVESPAAVRAWLAKHDNRYRSVYAAGEIVAAVTPGSTGLPKIYRTPRPADIAEIVAALARWPGWWACQGWRAELEGHNFLIDSSCPGDLRILECSVRRGLRINGEQWRGGLPPGGGDVETYLRRFVLGIGVRRLWGGL